MNPVDQEIALQIRRREKPTITVVNKVDNHKREISAAEFYGLGLDDPLYVSAYHNLGIHDLMERTASLLPPQDPEDEEVGVPRIAILGRTNVGKSMLLNAILGEERAIVSEIAGTTRDSLDTRFEFEGRPMVLVDTAGIRRRGQVRRGIERYSVLRAFRAIQRSDLAFLVMDASELATAQDAHVFGYAAESFKGVIAVVNKWDLVEDPTGTAQEEALWTVRRRLHFMPYVPIVFTSALERQGIGDLLRLAFDLYEERHRVVPHGKLQHVLLDAMANQPPASMGKRRVRHPQRPTGRCKSPHLRLECQRHQGPFFLSPLPRKPHQDRLRLPPDPPPASLQTRQEGLPVKYLLPLTVPPLLAIYVLAIALTMDVDQPLPQYLILVPLAYVLGSVPWAS